MPPVVPAVAVVPVVFEVPAVPEASVPMVPSVLCVVFSAEQAVNEIAVMSASADASIFFIILSPLVLCLRGVWRIDFRVIRDIYFYALGIRRNCKYVCCFCL